jgi:hypothetical protein
MHVGYGIKIVFVMYARRKLGSLSRSPVVRRCRALSPNRVCEISHIPHSHKKVMVDGESGLHRSVHVQVNWTIWYPSFP